MKLIDRHFKLGRHHVKMFGRQELVSDSSMTFNHRLWDNTQAANVQIDKEYGTPIQNITKFPKGKRLFSKK